MSGRRPPMPAWGWALIIAGSAMALLAIVAVVAAVGVVAALLFVFVGGPPGAAGTA